MGSAVKWLTPSSSSLGVPGWQKGLKADDLFGEKRPQAAWVGRGGKGQAAPQRACYPEVTTLRGYLVLNPEPAFGIRTCVLFFPAKSWGDMCINSYQAWGAMFFCSSWLLD